MNIEEKEYIQATIENEGVYYAFIHYSDFEEIKDDKFHELRKAFEKAAKELVDYCDCDL